MSYFQQSTSDFKGDHASVLMHPGVVGDGNNDDTAGIIKVIQNFESIFFPPNRTYKITANIFAGLSVPKHIQLGRCVVHASAEMTISSLVHIRSAGKGEVIAAGPVFSGQTQWLTTGAINAFRLTNRSQAGETDPLILAGSSLSCIQDLCVGSSDGAGLNGIVIDGFASGFVNIADSGGDHVVTLIPNPDTGVYGTRFYSGMVGKTITFYYPGAGTPSTAIFTILSVTDSTHLKLTASAGTHSGAVYTQGLGQQTTKVKIDNVSVSNFSEAGILMGDGAIICEVSVYARGNKYGAVVQSDLGNDANNNQIKIVGENNSNTTLIGYRAQNLTMVGSLSEGTGYNKEGFKFYGCQNLEVNHPYIEHKGGQGGSPKPVMVSFNLAHSGYDGKAYRCMNPIWNGGLLSFLGDLGDAPMYTIELNGDEEARIHAPVVITDYNILPSDFLVKLILSDQSLNPTIDIPRMECVYIEDNGATNPIIRELHERYHPNGGLFEPATTNNILWSEDLTNAAWGGFGAPITVALVASTNPFGESQNISRLTLAACGAGGTHSVYQGFALDGDSHTFSLWLRAAVPHMASLYMDDPGVGYAVTRPVAVGTAWRRYALTVPAGLCTVGLRPRIAVIPDLLATASSVTLDVWGVQFETGGVSKYIPTTTVAVTRPAGFYARSVNASAYLKDGSALAMSDLAGSPSFPALVTSTGAAGGFRWYDQANAGIYYDWTSVGDYVELRRNGSLLLTIDNSGNITVPGANVNGLVFAKGASAQIAWEDQANAGIYYSFKSVGDYVELYRNTSLILTIDSSGNVTAAGNVKTGNIFQAGASAGITQITANPVSITTVGGIITAMS